MGKSLNRYIEEAIKENWNELALTDFNGNSFKYADIARKIEKLHILFEEAGVKKGDKIALCGKNCAQWAVAFLATVTYRAVPVPLLHEFKADNLHFLVNHSEAKLFFVDSTIWENLDPSVMENVEGVLNIADYSLLLSRNEKITEARNHLNEMFGKRYPERFTVDDVNYEDNEPEELALLNYTSGSMGFSKGVMVPARAVESNLKFCLDNLDFFHRTDSMISMLPLAHMFGLVIEMLHPFVRGCHLYFLTRVPSPKVILDAFAQVKPKLIITVPLVIEKIIKKRVFPILEQPLMKILLKVPFVDDRLLAKVQEKIYASFGGNLCELIVGGAALNREVGTLLHRIHFPITEGYGMTECAPLISYVTHKDSRIGSCGKIVERMEAHIDSPDPENIPGELWVRGDNVMLGYYKNEEATSAIMKDGWMNTGDLATMDKEGFLYLRGRSKNMILGPSGQNIYPEEIEQLVNNLPFVNESLVIEEDNRLKALVYPDFESANQAGITSTTELSNVITTSVLQLNKELPNYSQIAGVQIYNEEFEKTPKRSIKRYLYQH
ncbi:MAG: AMP-binding protein [Muribaculaceae bacterium]|nr:AMP-binding protein [Muribaculaceae bacterium]